MSETVDVLNAAFKADPNAIHALICNQVPCNRDLADDPFVQVEDSLVLVGDNFRVGMLGVLNGVLEANGLPMVAAKFSRVNDNGRAELLGFCEPTKE